MPDGWAWTRLKGLFTVCSSKRVLQSDWKKNGIPFYRAREIVELSDSNFVDNELFISEKQFHTLSKNYSVPLPGDLMVSGVGTIGKVYIVKPKDRFYYKDASVLCFENRSGFVVPEFARILLESEFIQKQMKDNSKGTTVDTITISTAMNYLCIIPPIKEQIRIISVVQHIVNQTNIIHERKKGLQTLVTSAKEKILDLAIRGKLVPQNDNDEPASVLLERIRVQKEELIKQGKIKRDKRESVIYRGTDNSYYERFTDGSEKCIDEEIPFEIPKGWAWTHLSDITQILNGDRGQNYPAKNKLITKGIPFVSASNIESGVVSSNNLLCMTEEQYDALRAGKLIDNDIVYCIRGSLGKCGVFTMSKGAIASSLAIIRPFHTLYILREYLFLYLNSPLARSEIQKYDNGSAQPNLAAKDLMNFLVPLPPPMEAKMIVQKVKNIFTRVEEINAASM